MPSLMMLKSTFFGAGATSATTAGAAVGFAAATGAAAGFSPLLPLATRARGGGDFGDSSRCGGRFGRGHRRRGGLRALLALGDRSGWRRRGRGRRIAQQFQIHGARNVRIRDVLWKLLGGLLAMVARLAMHR